MSFLSQLSAALAVPYTRKAVVIVPRSDTARKYARDNRITSIDDQRLVKGTGAYAFTVHYAYLEVEPDHYLQLLWEHGRWVDSMSKHYITDDGTAIRRLDSDSYTWEYRVVTIPFDLPHTEAEWEDDEYEESDDDSEDHGF